MHERRRPTRAGRGSRRAALVFAAALVASILPVLVMSATAPAAAAEATNGMIAYSAEPPCPEGGCDVRYQRIWAQDDDVDSSDRVWLTESSETSSQQWAPRWSPDGNTAVYYQGYGSFELGQVRADGSGAKAFGYAGHSAQHPDWSADGQWVYYRVYNSDPNSPIFYHLWRVRPDGTGTEQVPWPSSMAFGGNFAFAPDGRLVFYGARTGDAGNHTPGIYVMDLSAGTAATASLLVGEDELPGLNNSSRLDVSSTGVLLFDHYDASATQTGCVEATRIPYVLYTVPVTGGSPTRISPPSSFTGPDYTAAAWSPDGTQIVASSQTYRCSDRGVMEYAESDTVILTAQAAFVRSLGLYVFYGADWQPCTADTIRCTPPEGAAQPTPSPTPSPTQPPASADEYVAMGDSFQSGEGAETRVDVPGDVDRNEFRYESGTDIDNVNECHRSPEAYGPQLASALGYDDGDFSFVACSGAVIENLYGADTDDPSSGPPWNEDAQLDALSATTELVTIGVGGNDMGFASILKDCLISRFSCVPDWEPKLFSRLEELKRRLSGRADDDPDDVYTAAGLYADIRERAPHAKVVVVGYPKFFDSEMGPEGSGAISTCKTIGYDEQSWINYAVTEVNAVLQRAAYDAGFEWQNIYSLADDIELCSGADGGEFLNGVVGSTAHDWQAVGNESFHPTARAHDLITAELFDTITSDTADERFTLTPQERAVHTMLLRSGLGGFTVSTRWPGSDVVMSLRSPSGRVIERSSTDSDVQHQVGPTHEVFTVEDPEPGEWSIELYGADVAEEGEEVELRVDEVEQPNSPPVASFTQTEGPTVSFDASGSSDPDGEIASYHWMFGDGTTATGRTVTHTYTDGAMYEPRLVVLDDEGLAGVAVGQLVSGPAGSPIRLAGTSRYETSNRIADDLVLTGSAQAVVLAKANDFPDALAGTPLAVAKGGPLLLTSGTELLTETVLELERLLPKGRTVYLLGGTAALSSEVEGRVQALGYTTVRYGGQNRYDTARVIAEQGLGSPDRVLLATGRNFPDALVAGTAAAAIGGAVLLTDNAGMPAVTSGYLSSRSVSQLYALGGQAAAAAPKAVKLAGANRYATARLVADRFFPDPPTVGLARGDAFADALSGGAHIATHGGPLLLTPSTQLAEEAAGYLRAHRDIGSPYVYGGVNAVSDQVVGQVKGALAR